MQHDNILVLSPSKTGTQSVYRALRAALGGENVHHAHFISQAALARLAKKNNKSVPRWLSSAEAITKGTVGLVTLVREPVARIMSAYAYYGKRANGPPVSFDVYVQKQVQIQKTWYENELGALGLSLFNAASPATTGFAVQRAGRFTFVVIRLEDLDSCGVEALSAVTDRPLSLKRLNATDEELKLGVISSHAMPDAVMEGLHDLPEVRFCYTAAELQRYREDWRRLWRSSSNAVAPAQ